jgi:GGDEF domain-containing protein
MTRRIDGVCIAERTGSTPTAAELFVAGVRLHTLGPSIGTAVHSGDAADVAALYASADASLYAAKRERFPDTRDPDLRHAR